MSPISGPEIIDLSHDTPGRVNITATARRTGTNTRITTRTGATNTAVTADVIILLSDSLDEEETAKRVDERPSKRARLESNWEDRASETLSAGEEDELPDLFTANWNSRLGREKRPYRDVEASTETLPRFSQRTSTLLAGIDTDEPVGKTTSIRPGLVGDDIADLGTMSSRNKKKNAVSEREPTEDSGIVDEPAQKATRSRRTEAEKKDREQARAQRERDKQARAKEKAAEKERKEKLKEEKAREKQKAADLAQANKSRTDKKSSTPEMIAVLPLTLDETTSVGGQVRGFLQNVGVDVVTYDAPMPNVIKWRRKVTVTYNEGLGHWEPTPLSIQEEKHVLCLMSAKEFVGLACVDANRPDGQDLDAHVLRFKSKFEDHKLIYLIEGLTSWMRTNKNVRNRAYQARALGDSAAGDAERPHAPRRKKATAEYVDEDMIEDALLRLQVVHKCLIHHTATAIQTAEWITIFTQHISTIPYRTERMNLQTTFCMDVGQVKTGVDASDTYIKMLQEMVRVTAPVAYGIAAAYPDVHSLFHGLELDGPLALQDLKKTANKNGSFTNANIGPAISKRVYKIFRGFDPLDYVV